MSEARIFNTGGVAALVGNAYGAAKDVGVYVTAKRSEGLLILKPRNVNGLPTSHRKLLPRVAEHTARIAERQGQLMVEMVQAALPEVDLSAEQASTFKAALARQARQLTTSPEI